MNMGLKKKTCICVYFHVVLGSWVVLRGGKCWVISCTCVAFLKALRQPEFSACRHSSGSSRVSALFALLSGSTAGEGEQLRVSGHGGGGTTTSFSSNIAPPKSFYRRAERVGSTPEITSGVYYLGGVVEKKCDNASSGRWMPA